MRADRRLSNPRSEFPRPVAASRNIPIIVLITLLAFFTAGPALHAQETSSVGLGTADDFAVLADETITNTGDTTITGDVGLHPGTAVDGFGSVTLNGDLHVDDAVAEQANVDLVTAYNDAAGRPVTATIPTELGGETLTAGVYDSAAGTFGITGTLILDAQDDPNAVFIFKMASTLTTAAASSVSLINGAQACNVFWQVGSSATLGTNSSLMGNILALTSITLNTGATVEGRTLARDGSVTLDTNTITRAICTSSTTTTTAADDTTTTTAADNTTTTTAADDTTTTTATDDTTTTTEDSTVITTAEDTTTTVAPPVGGVEAGGGSTSGASSMIPLVGGLSLLAAAGGVLVARRRLLDRRSG